MSLDLRLNHCEAWAYEHVRIRRFNVYFGNTTWDSGYAEHFTIAEIQDRLSSFGLVEGYATLGHAYNLTRLCKYPVQLAEHFPSDGKFYSFV